MLFVYRDACYNLAAERAVQLSRTTTGILSFCSVARKRSATDTFLVNIRI